MYTVQYECTLYSMSVHCSVAHIPRVHVLVPAAVPGQAVGHEDEAAVLLRVGAGARALPPGPGLRMRRPIRALASFHPGHKDEYFAVKCEM